MIDRHKQVVESYRRGSSWRWVACLAASRVVGNYDRGKTQALAIDLALSVSQVENLARAGLTYRRLRKYGVGGLVRLSLTPGHFAAMGELIRRYDLSPFEAASDLCTAAEIGASIAVMRAEIDRREGGGGMYWEGRWRRIRNDLLMLLTDIDAPPEVKKRAKRASRFIR